MNLPGILQKYYSDFVRDFPGASRELEFIFLKLELENLRATHFKNDWDQRRLEELEEWKCATQRLGAWR